jgi:hypothetical protein
MDGWQSWTPQSPTPRSESRAWLNLSTYASTEQGQISALVRNLGEEFTRQLTIALSLPSLVDEFEQRALELGSTVHHPKVCVVL